MQTNKLTFSASGDDNAEYACFNYISDVSSNLIVFEYNPELLNVYETLVDSMKNNTDYLFETKSIHLNITDGYVKFDVRRDEPNEPFSSTEFKLKTEYCVEAFEQWIKRVRRSKVEQ